MQNWRLRLLGIDSIPGWLSELEIEQFFTLAAPEIATVRSRRGETLQLGLALHIGFLRMAGCALNGTNALPNGQNGISINGGTMAAADAVTYTGVRFPATHVGPVKTTAAISGATGAAAGYTVVADCNLFFIDTPGIAVGASTVYGLLITGVDLLVHTSGVVAAADGNIVVVELPG